MNAPTPDSVHETLQTALRHHQAGNLPLAEAIYRQVLHRDPDQPDALHWLGLLARQSGRNDVAIGLLARAAALAPGVAAYQHNAGDLWLTVGELDQAAAAFRRAVALAAGKPESYAGLGVALLRSGRAAEAATALQKAVELNLDRPDVHHSLAVALLQSDRPADAEPAARAALTLKPDFADAHHTLGEILGKLYRLDDAIAAFRQAVALAPDNPRPHHGLGAALGLQRKFDEAAESFRTALRLRPDYPEAHRGLGVVLLQQKRPADAIGHYERTIALRPEDLVARVELATALEQAGRRDEAAAQYRDLLRLRPGHPEVLFQLAALTGQDVPLAAPPSTMVALFDGYAEKFDEHLTGHLKYRCPELLHEAVAALNPGTGLNVLDLGCGTGLCGPLFRPLAGTLAGVDLSPGMVDKARRRGVYDRLDVTDLVTALRGSPGAIDLLLAADVLVYVGDLTPVFAAAASALRPGGLFAFSVEEHHGPGYTLLATRRYAHSAEYVKAEAARAGLEVIDLHGAIPRTENGQNVPALIVVLRRAAGAPRDRA